MRVRCACSFGFYLWVSLKHSPGGLGAGGERSGERSGLIFGERDDDECDDDGL